ncbi:MAG: hypothetical protein E7317_10615 [Clostridiales bacterium]|nr:hypothetical protein [Clostridiales bacterium]
MAYCSNCGVLIDGVVRYCPNCGVAVNLAAATNAGVQGDYRIILISKGTCSRTNAINLLEDLFEYTTAQAATIVDSAPMEAALGLTATQAQYIAQAMTEYGMDVSVYDSNGYVDLDTRATASVYNTDGSLLGAVATALLGLGAVNRVTRYERWSRPAPRIFRPTYRRPAPPPPRRITRRPAPMPPVPPRQPGPVVRQPAPRPAPARRQPAPPVQPRQVGPRAGQDKVIAPAPRPVAPGQRPVAPQTPQDPRGGGRKPGPGGGRRG